MNWSSLSKVLLPEVGFRALHDCAQGTAPTIISLIFKIVRGEDA